MAQKYKIFLKEKLLMLEHRSGTNKREKILLILSPEELLDQVCNLQAATASKSLTLYTAIPVPFLLKKTFKVVKAAGGLVFNEKGELLVIKRHGLWDLPKGKLHPDENLAEAGIREVSEETGLSGLQIIDKAGETLHLYFNKNRFHIKDTCWYRMTYKGNETPVPQLEEDITEVRWCNKTEIPEILENTYSSLKEIITSNLPEQ
ncbi:MAG: NUDIX hydrolase [Bacteroidales bacterium]